MEGATVWVADETVNQELEFDFEARIRTGPKGRFALDRLPPGPITLLATEDDTLPKRRPLPEVLHTTTAAPSVVLVVTRRP